MASVYDFTVKLNNGDTLPLETLRGKVLVLFNTASRCGFTPQLAGPHRVELVCINEATSRINLSGGSGPLEVLVTPA